MDVRLPFRPVWISPGSDQAGDIRPGSGDRAHQVIAIEQAVQRNAKCVDISGDRVDTSASYEGLRR